jgi:hypothetical protein
VLFADHLCAADLSDQEPFSPVYWEFPLLSLMDMFSVDVLIHHVPVNDGDGNVIAFVSQSRVIEFLRKQMDDFPDVAEKKLKEFKQICNFGSRKVLTASLGDTALDAFRKMIDEVSPYNFLA